MDVALLIARLLLVAVFTLSGVAKLADQAGSRQAMIAFGVPRGLAKPFGLLLPLAELAVAAALLPAVTAWWGALGALALLVLFVVGISANLANGRKPDCRCFGQLHSAPVGWKTLARNGLLVAVAALVIWRGPENAGPSMVGWVGDLSVPQLLGFLFGLVIVTMLAIQGWFILHLLRQNGRVLVRLRALEAGLGMVPSGNPSGNGSQPGAGLPVGSAAPAFRLKDLRGEEVALHDLRAAGKPVVLIFTSPGCDACTELLPEIARWQLKHAEKLTISLISEMSIEENRAKTSEHGLQHVLMDQDGEVADSYHVEATPSAVLITLSGTVGSPLAEGPDAVEALITQAAGAPAQMPILHSTTAHATQEESRPAALEVGDPVPEVRLPGLMGEEVSLADLKGRKTLLLFWSTECSFCQQMLPDLKELEATPPADAPEILIVSDGTEEDNRQMGLQSSVVLDHEYAVEDAFGVEGTPSAVLVDEEGRMASEVAVGPEEVFKLARAG
ncbi:MAG: TlpA family protein disulfide reductase [Actinomycetota bacterium]|nr:TlpA family protein disulfide reductase [Actinomycetota bacterium]